MKKINRGRLLKFFLISAAVIMIIPAIILFIFIRMVSSGHFGEMPGKEALQDIRHHEASQVYSADSILLTTYYTENRSRTDLNEVSPLFIQALIATEDIRFYRHNGLDYRGTLRAILYWILPGNDAGGGSTITQQLAKNLFPRQFHGRLTLPVNKTKEVLIARRLESIYTKNEILNLYLNTVSFGEETYGIATASQRFFNKEPSDLQYHEAAMLAGMLKGPSMYHPVRFPERAMARRNTVLHQMGRYGFITPSGARLYMLKPAGLDYRPPSAQTGPAPYFTEHLRQELQNYLRENPANDGNNYNIYTDGLLIYTTIDSRLQKAAVDAVEKQLSHLQNQFNEHWQGRSLFSANSPAIRRAWQNSGRYKRLNERGYADEVIEEKLYEPVQTVIWDWNGRQDTLISPFDSIRHFHAILQAGFFAMEPQTGNVLAWVGGPAHRYFKYDQVKARRQPGSAFKPLIYATALQQGITPCDYYRNEQLIYENFEDWMPRNVDDEYGGRVAVHESLTRSLNTIAIRLLEDAGLDNVISLAGKAGIHSELQAKPSLALGTSPVSLMELTTAYTAFVNEGRSSLPRYITAIYDRNGNLLYDFPAPNPDEKDTAMTPREAMQMTAMLEQAVRNGTGRRLHNSYDIRMQVAGKTGTTQNYADGWFVGFTPDVVFGSRVGGITNNVRFRSGALGSGSATALPVAAYFLESISDESVNRSFQITQEIKNELTCSPYKDDRFIDRARDFFRGDGPRRTEFSDDEEEKREWYDPRGWFGN